MALRAMGSVGQALTLNSTCPSSPVVVLSPERSSSNPIWGRRNRVAAGKGGKRKLMVLAALLSTGVWLRSLAG